MLVLLKMNKYENNYPEVSGIKALLGVWGVLHLHDLSVFLHFETQHDLLEMYWSLLGVCGSYNEENWLNGTED